MPGSDVFNLYTTPLVSHTYTPVLTDDEVSGAVTRDTSSAPGNAAPITQTFTNPLSLCPAYQVYIHIHTHIHTYIHIYKRMYIKYVHM